MSTFECVAIAAAAGGSDAQPRGRPRREAPTGQVTEGGGHRRSRRGDAATIATAASCIPVAAALCAQAIVNIVKAVCRDILVSKSRLSRVANRVNSFHVQRRCQNSLRNSSKGDCTKTGDGRKQMDSRCSEQLFTGNRPDDARGSNSAGVWFRYRIARSKFFEK